MFNFIKTTAIGGLLFILPLVLVIVLVEKAIHLLRGPIEKLLPMFAGYDVAGVTLISCAALLGLVLACFVAGLLAKTRAASNGLRLLEDNLLSNLPGYQLFKDATARFAGLENEDGSKVGMIAEGDGWRLCLVLEAADPWVTVFMPDGGPAGCTAGEVRLLPASEVVVTDLAWLPLMAALRRGGRGAAEMLQPWLAKS